MAFRPFEAHFRCAHCGLCAHHTLDHSGRHIIEVCLECIGHGDALRSFSFMGPAFDAPRSAREYSYPWDTTPACSAQPPTPHDTPVDTPLDTPFDSPQREPKRERTPEE